MTENEKINLVKAFIGDNDEATDEVISAYLSVAKNAILVRRYINVPQCADVPAQYEILQCRLAERYFNRRGAEGEISHNENSINRSYGSINDEDLLSEIVSVVKVV